MPAWKIPEINIRTACSVEGYDQDDDHVTVRLSGGETVAGALLVGADGLWSKVRQQVVGDGAPRVTGHSTYRSVIPTEQMPEDLRWNAATCWAGPKCHIVHYPLSGWKVFNLVVTYHNDAPAPVAGLPVTEDEVMAGFHHVHPKAREVIRHGKDWKLWVLCDREPVENWIDGRVALLGDAAHPTLQYMAQGACMAMEDGVCLSHELAVSPNDHAAALERYRRQRVLRTARIQLQSRAMGDHVLHPSGAHAALRNAIMSAKTDAEWYDSLAWPVRWHGAGGRCLRDDGTGRGSGSVAEIERGLISADLRGGGVVAWADEWVATPPTPSMRCGRRSGVPAPASSSGHERRRQPRLSQGHPGAIAFRRRSISDPCTNASGAARRYR